MDRGEDWLQEIRDCGEPPAVARVVELLAQWEYVKGEDWSPQLVRTASSQMRSQWTRAWLLGPLAASDFERDETQFADAVFADNCRLLKKALVWFQAEKTTPNPNILAGNLPQEQRLRFADLLGWPSDFAAWRRIISFLLRRISDIPVSLYPEVLAIFEVWQNALADRRNPLSQTILTHCAEWLRNIDAVSSAKKPDANSALWEQVSDLGDFRKSLSRLILRASRAEPGLAEDYLNRVIASERIRENKFEEIVAFSPTLAQSHPHLLVELTLKHVMEELPDDQVARERAEFERAAERRKRALAKPESERTRSTSRSSTSTLQPSRNSTQKLPTNASPLPSSANKSNHAPISIGGQVRSSRINQPETVSADEFRAALLACRCEFATSIARTSENPHDASG